MYMQANATTSGQMYKNTEDRDGANSRTANQIDICYKVTHELPLTCGNSATYCEL